MTLYMIGLGLHDEKDITVKGLEAIKNCDAVYLETYTSSLSVDIHKLEGFYGKSVIPANRALVEQQAEETILKDAKEGDAAFLVIGDPFGATTHTDLKMRAMHEGIEVVVINNASILNAIGIVGLELYKFGKATSIPFANDGVKTPFEVFQKNDKNKLHTLILLDLDPDNEKYMTIKEALEFLIKLGLDKDRKCVGCAGIGASDAEIACSSAELLAEKSFTKYPQCLIIPSDLHFVEEDMLGFWKD